MLASQIQQYVKSIIHHIQVKFTPGMQDWLYFWKSNNVIHCMHKLKRKNHTIIMMDATEVSDKIQHQFVIKTLCKLCVEDNLTQISGLWKTEAKIILNVDRLNTLYHHKKNKDIHSHYFFSTLYFTCKF